MSRVLSRLSALSDASIVMETDVLKRHMKNYGDCVQAFIGDAYVVPGPLTVQLGVHDDMYKTASTCFQSIDASSLIHEAIEKADNFAFDSKNHSLFLERLVSVVEKHINVLQQAANMAARNYGHEGRLLSAALHKMFDNCFTFTGDCELDGRAWSSTPLVAINGQECDVVFYIGRILRLLQNPFHNGSPHGIVIVCASSRLKLPLFVLTTIITECRPPPNLYAFLPVTMTETSHGCPTGGTLPIVFHSSDLDSSALSWVNAVRNHWNSHWSSPVILVEESVETKFIVKLNHYLTSSSTLTKSDSLHTDDDSQIFSKPIDNHHISLLNSKYGVRKIAINDADNFSVTLLRDFPPAALTEVVNRDPEPVGYVIRFRTPREAVTLATHLLNNRLCGKYRLFDCGISLAANLWLSSAALCWQLACSLGESGYERIFINAPYEHLLLSMYTCISGPYTCSSLLPLLCVPDSIIYGDVLANFSQLLLLTLEAQKIWSTHGVLGIQKRLFDAAETLHNGTIAVKRAWKVFRECSITVLGELQSFECRVSSKSEDVLLSRQWLLPAGPVILFLSDVNMSEDFENFIICLILQALFAGNSVLVYGSREKCNCENYTSFLASFKQWQARLPSDILMLHTYDLDTQIRPLELLAGVNLHGLVVDVSKLWNLSFDTTDASVRILRCFSKVLKMFWSVGGEIFAN